MFKTDITYQTLSQYLSEIRDLIQEFTDYRWIVAEIAKVDLDKSGHYWFELVERSQDEIIAQVQAVLWRGSIDTVYNFLMKTGVELQKGIKILFLGKAIFHEKYGFKLNIIQIDPAFTLGEMALKKKEVVERLTKEGLIERNKLIELPVVIQRIAVVSSETAAGYEDFLKILKENQYGYKFHIKLFDAFVQGETAVPSIIDALHRCALNAKNFDAVVLIRGGGSVVDLQCFNDYELAKKIALMPIAVLTGIGHTRDDTVADCVAHRSFKTPSEVAKFIVEKALDYDLRIEHLSKMILHRVESFLKVEASKNQDIEEKLKTALRNCIEKLNSRIHLILSGIHNSALKRLHTQREKIFSLKHTLHKNTNLRLKNEELSLSSLKHKVKLKIYEHLTKEGFTLKSCKEKIKSTVYNIFKIKNLQIQRLSETLNLLSPENVLKRGYSITYLNGKVLKSSKEVSTGEQVHIQLYKGKITGEVIKKEEENGEPKLF